GPAALVWWVAARVEFRKKLPDRSLRRVRGCRARGRRRGPRDCGARRRSARGVPEVSPAGQRTCDQQGYGAPSRAVILLEVRMVWSFVYLALRHLLELIVLCWRSTDAQEVEILVLRHQLPVLRRQQPR